MDNHSAVLRLAREEVREELMDKMSAVAANASLELEMANTHLASQLSAMATNQSLSLLLLNESLALHVDDAAAFKIDIMTQLSTQQLNLSESVANLNGYLSTNIASSIDSLDVKLSSYIDGLVSNASSELSAVNERVSIQFLEHASNHSLALAEVQESVDSLGKNMSFSLTSLDERVSGNLNNSLDSLDSKISAHITNITMEHSNQIDSMDKTFREEIDQSVSALDVKLTSHVSDVSTSITSVFTATVDSMEQSLLDKLERASSDQTKSFVSVADQMEGLGMNVSVSLKEMAQFVNERTEAMNSTLKDATTTLGAVDQSFSEAIKILQDRTGRIKADVEGLQSKLATVVETTLPALSERMVIVENSMSSHARRLDVIEGESDRVKRTGANREELDAVRTMLFELQSAVMANSGKVLEIVSQMNSPRTGGREL